MGNKQRLFIYDRKEMTVLILLGVAVAFFAFTLGVHLGKRVAPKTASGGPKDALPVVTIRDQIPERNEIAEQSKGMAQKVDETLHQTLEEAVTQTGLKLDTPRPLELPQNLSQKQTSALRKTPSPLMSPSQTYTLQVGSYPELAAAKSRVQKLITNGLEDAFFQEVDLKEKGKRYRVFAGNFGSVDEAKAAGVRYQAKNLIDTFIVSNKVH